MNGYRSTLGTWRDISVAPPERPDLRDRLQSCFFHIDHHALHHDRFSTQPLRLISRRKYDPASDSFHIGRGSGERESRSEDKSEQAANLLPAIIVRTRHTARPRIYSPKEGPLCRNCEDGFGSNAAVQNSEKTSIQCPSLPNSGESVRTRSIKSMC